MRFLERHRINVGFAALSPRHASTWSYLGWAGLYLCVGLYQSIGGSISEEFAELFVADFFINLASPFILGGGAVLAVWLGGGTSGTKWYELILLTVVFVVTMVIPAAVLFGVGGLPLFLSALLFFSKVGWLGIAKGKGKLVALLIVRGFAGPFLFFVPSLLISTVVVGRSTLGLNETDWVALFGVIYFLIQAIFEEFLLRKTDESGSNTPRTIIEAHNPDRSSTSD